MIRRVVDEYPQIRRISDTDMSFICVDLGPGKKPRFKLPTDEQVWELPEGPNLTHSEANRIDRCFQRRGL